MANKIYALYWIPLLACVLFSYSCGEVGTFVSNADTCDGYAPSKTSAYVLPITVGRIAKTSQGNCGVYTHKGIIRYAYDIWSDSGEPILATRGGTVIDTRSDVSDGNNLYNVSNFVHIKHSDGTIGSYAHLLKDTVLVTAGETVSQGQRLGLMGASGTVQPHLHFQVYNNDSDYYTIPITFKNTDENNFGLKADSEYPVFAYVPSGQVLITPQIYKNTDTDCTKDGTNPTTGKPDASDLIEISTEQKTKHLVKDDGLVLSVECNYTAATTNAIISMISFDASSYKLGDVSNLTLVIRGAAGSYTSMCDGTTTLATDGGASPPLRSIQIYQYNAGVSPEWVDATSLTNDIISKTAKFTDTGAYKYTDGKVWFRIIGGNPGAANQCSSVAIDYIKLEVNP